MLVQGGNVKKQMWHVICEQWQLIQKYITTTSTTSSTTTTSTLKPCNNVPLMDRMSLKNSGC